ncbi:hypothetical protein GCM10023108_49640 [Saccharopolyspora hordei]
MRTVCLVPALPGMGDIPESPSPGPGAGAAHPGREGGPLGERDEVVALSPWIETGVTPRF